jgi:hypothetical protein
MLSNWLPRTPARWIASSKSTGFEVASPLEGLTEWGLRSKAVPRAMGEDNQLEPLRSGSCAGSRVGGVGGCLSFIQLVRFHKPLNPPFCRTVPDELGRRAIWTRASLPRTRPHLAVWDDAGRDGTRPPRLLIRRAAFESQATHPF